MEIELINQDINNYLDKYTRFMSKKVYITKRMYDNFVSSYDYIYDSANKSIINYNNDKKYKKLLDIKDKGIYALKIHNKKYLEDKYIKYNDFFSENLSKSEKLGILCEEDIVVMDTKNIDNKVDIIKNKVSYLIDKCNVKKSSICIIADDNIKNRLQSLDVATFNYIEFLSNTFLLDRKIVNEDDRYKILSNYIKNILYKDKKKFKKFYETFKDKLLFNDDCLDFETFSDYHYYMFKRSFLSSNSELSLFVKKMIIKRKNNLRSISGNTYDNSILVDIDNTLFCSGINYKYINREYFLITNDDISNKIIFIDRECDSKIQDGEDIYLYSKYKDGSSYIEHLVYELVKRRYPILKKGYEEIYSIFSKDASDNYFVKFIDCMVIPYIEMIWKYDYNNNTLSDIYNNLEGKLRDEFGVLLDFYNYYCGYLEENNFIDKKQLIYLSFKYMSRCPYKYFIIDDDGNIDLDNFKGNFKLLVLSQVKPQSYSYLISNVKLFCDFKKYLSYNKLIPIPNIYYGCDEIERLACEFTSLNMDRVCNVYGDAITHKKKVLVYIYDDGVRLKSDINCNYLLSHIISTKFKNIDNNIMIMARDQYDFDSITTGDYFIKDSSLKVYCSLYPSIGLDCFTMNSKQNKVYDSGILIHPMDDKYGFLFDYRKEEVFRLIDKDSNNNFYNWEKKLFYMAISRVGEKLYVVCPKSRVAQFVKNIANHNDVMVKKEIFVSDK